jgi:Spy/CpxP family protein refolding chaperone
LFSQSSQALQNVEKIAKTLKLTPEQKVQLLPILKTEAPRLEAVKNNPSLTGIQKLEQLKAIHAETDPQVRSILTPEQYQQLQEIRRKEIQEAIKKRMGAQ